MSFRKELRNLINRYSIENESNTPDGILASYLISCLDAFNKAIKGREKWYGRPKEKFETDTTELESSPEDFNENFNKF